MCPSPVAEAEAGLREAPGLWGENHSQSIAPGSGWHSGLSFPTRQLSGKAPSPDGWEGFGNMSGVYYRWEVSFLGDSGLD